MAYLPAGRQVFGKRNEKSPQFREAGYFAQKIGIKIYFIHNFVMTNRLISEKIVSWDFVPPFDFTAQFLASRAVRRGEQTIDSPRQKSLSPIWCALFENARTFFEQKLD